MVPYSCGNSEGGLPAWGHSCSSAPVMSNDDTHAGYLMVTLEPVLVPAVLSAIALSPVLAVFTLSASQTVIHLT